MSLPKDHLDEFPWEMGWLWPCIYDYNEYKTRETQMHKMHEQRGWIVWCTTCCMKFLKYDSSWHWIVWCLHMLHEVLKIWFLLTSNRRHLSLPSWITTQSRWRSKMCLIPWITTSHLPLVAIPNWCGENCVAKASQNWRHKMWLGNQYNAMWQWDKLHLKA